MHFVVLYGFKVLVVRFHNMANPLLSQSKTEPSRPIIYRLRLYRLFHHFDGVTSKLSKKYSMSFVLQITFRLEFKKCSEYFLRSWGT